ncbi:MAG TPA: methyltransferase domain-containing protein [Firmicutes bacterium]|nr:methyltransferase domain-containing protein [Candidatus Fermentithermobacillaceae bacterium]
MVSVIVYSFDGSERLSKCVQSMEAATPESHEIIEAPLKSPRGRPLSMTESLNRAASAAQGDYLVFMTADTVVSAGWLARLIACAEETGAGAVGPLCNMATGLQNAPALKPGTVLSPDPSKWRPSVRIAMAPMLVRRDTFFEVGGFDERFGPEGFADDDFCLRLALTGRKAYIAGDVYVHRLGPRHPLQGEPERIRILDGEARRMCTKSGLDDPMAAHPRRDVLGLVEVEGKRVLDLRARTGANLLECAARGARVAYGVEEDPRLRRVAETYCPAEETKDGRGAEGEHPSNGALNGTELGILRSLREASSHRPYDVAIAIWHLECMTNPVSYLKRLKQLIAEGGVLLACVRNAWALSRLLPLLLTAPPPTYPRPAWGPCAAPDDVLGWLEESGYEVLSVKTAYAPPLGKEPFLNGFMKLVKSHGFIEDPKPELYSDECWFTARIKA